MLLAVDLGLRCGLARFDLDARLSSYRTTRFPSRRTLSLAASTVIDQQGEGLLGLVCEGDRRMLGPWEREAERRGLPLAWVDAATWRRDLLLPRERRSSREAKAAACELARRVIDASACRRPTSLRHDACEAICLGAWYLWHGERLPELPDWVGRPLGRRRG